MASTTTPTCSAAELAQRTGVDATYIERLAALGILVLVGEEPGRFRATDVRRVAIIRALESGGVGLEGIGEAFRNGSVNLEFMEQSSYERFGSLTDETFEQLSARTGIPLEIVLAIREACGGARAERTDRVRELETQVTPMLQAQLEGGVRPAVVEQALRGYGDSLRRIADIESAWWRSDMLGPLVAAGFDMAKAGAATAEWSDRLANETDGALLAILHSHESGGWQRNILEGFEMALVQAGLHERVERPPAICFLDLTGYTRLTDQFGDEAAAELAGRLSRMVQAASGRHGGRPVKWLGDGVMFVFPEPAGGVRAALEMVADARVAELPPAHVGLHAGPVLFQEGDYFGRTVNLAARIADYARQGEVLVSQEVVDASLQSDLGFREIGPVELKGIPEPVRLHVALAPD
ncbi:MAG TPA: adenylate/guanylate cyclase domain-containing protein [Candidatus Limnocylindrales bacterium]|nr:adenylate/guanylate cyclase domain-containing protein [Candidatus Limnocylindrales bacterium]